MRDDMRDDAEPSVRLERPKALEEMSVDELEHYAGKLEAELEQVRATIRQKRDYLSGAQGFFKV
jgi:uncharacterized small protein (DUF1192 family)